MSRTELGVSHCRTAAFWRRHVGAISFGLLVFAMVGSQPVAAFAACADSCEFPYGDGNCPTLGCCGGDGQRQCCTGCAFSDAPSACKPGYVVEADALCHKPCVQRKGCTFPYGDGNCPTLGCCGGDGERICVVGPGSDAPSACKSGLVTEADLKCHQPCAIRKGCSFPYGDGNCPTLGCCGGAGERECCVGCIGSDAPSACAPGLVPGSDSCVRPRTIGEHCGPAFPCVSGLQCIPFVQKCAPDAGNQLFDKNTCLSFYSADLAHAAVDNNETMNYGISSGASAGVGGSYAIGNVYGQDGRYGCYLTYCFGGESDVAAGSAVCSGISDSWDSFEGGSFVTVEGGGEGVEFSTSQSYATFDCFTSNPAPPCLNGNESCVGVGAGIAPFAAGGYQCETIVNTVLGNPAASAANTPPQARCKNQSASLTSGCTVAVSIDNGSSDPDSGDSITLVQTPAGPYGPGTTNVTLAASDSSGAASTCTARVTVTDDAPPTIICPPNMTIYTGSASTTCGQTATWAAPSAHDNCPGFSLDSNHKPGDTLPGGETTRVTYNATDTGNTTTCSFTVTVVDNSPPRITGCPSNLTFYTGPASTTCDQIATWVEPKAEDNCSVASFEANDHPGHRYPVGSTTLTYEALDRQGLGAECSFDVKVVDNTPPTITCPAPIVVDAESADGSNVTFVPMVTDNCGASHSEDPPAGSVFPIGTTTVTSTATDLAMQHASCQFTVHVVAADLAMAKNASPDPVAAGAPLTYTLDLTNDGPDSAANVQVIDATPPDTTFVSLTRPAGWSCASPAVGSSGEIKCTKAAVADGESATFTLVVRLLSSLSDGWLENRVSVGSTTPDVMPLNNEASTTTSVVTRADMLVSSGSARPVRLSDDEASDSAGLASDMAPLLLPGTDFAVPFTVTNNGTSDAQGVSITGMTPEHTSFSKLLAPPGWTCTTPPVGGAGTLTCTTPTVGAGASSTFTFVFHIDANAPKGAKITATTTVTSSTSDPQLANNQDAVSMFVYNTVPLLDYVGMVGLVLLLLTVAGRSLRAAEANGE